MLACNYAALMLEKGEFQKAEVLFKQAIKGDNMPNAYYGLALLYRMAGEDDAPVLPESGTLINCIDIVDFKRKW